MSNSALSEYARLPAVNHREHFQCFKMYGIGYYEPLSRLHPPLVNTITPHFLLVLVHRSGLRGQLVTRSLTFFEGGGEQEGCGVLGEIAGKKSTLVANLGVHRPHKGK